MLEIEIKKADTGNLAAEAEGITLFEFAYRKEVGGWLFWATIVPKEWKGRAFPLAYFLELCRAVFFLKTDEKIPESAAIISGKSYVK